jgi:hypothetical protein
VLEAALSRLGASVIDASLPITLDALYADLLNL